MKALVSIFLLDVSLHPASAQWVLQPSVTTADLWQVRFTDRNNGRILGQYLNRSGTILSASYRSTVLTTTDAGNTWQEHALDNCLLHEWISSIH